MRLSRIGVDYTVLRECAKISSLWNRSARQLNNFSYLGFD